MFKTKSEFDYQSIIEACEIQDVNIKKALNDKNGTVTELQEQFNKLKSLSKEKDQKNENLSILKASMGNNLLKLNKNYNKLSILNKEHKVVQDEILQLNAELQQKSDNFMERVANMDNELKLLYSQFEGETLTSLLSDLNTELLSTLDHEAQLEKCYEQLKQSTSTFYEYERLHILKSVAGDMSEHKQFEEVEKKLANKKRNIQFLMTEYNKKMERLQKLP